MSSPVVVEVSGVSIRLALNLEQSPSTRLESPPESTSLRNGFDIENDDDFKDEIQNSPEGWASGLVSKILSNLLVSVCDVSIIFEVPLNDGTILEGESSIKDIQVFSADNLWKKTFIVSHCLIIVIFSHCCVGS